jgi:hypothetical protein
MDNELSDSKLSEILEDANWPGLSSINIDILHRLIVVAYKHGTLAAEAEIVRLQNIINGFADRIAAQSELLSKRAEPEQNIYYKELEKED